jgi:hypothetical protein
MMAVTTLEAETVPVQTPVLIREQAQAPAQERVQAPALALDPVPVQAPALEQAPARVQVLAQAPALALDPVPALEAARAVAQVVAALAQASEALPGPHQTPSRQSRTEVVPMGITGPATGA